MAKLTDKFFNRVIEGPLEMEQSDVKSLEGKDLKVKKLESTSDAKIGGKLDVTGNAVFSGSINGEANPSVKPIYFHPIYVYISGGGNPAFLSLMILDNQSEAYTATTLQAKLKDLLDNGASIILGGGVAHSGNTYGNAYLWQKVGANYTLYYISPTGEDTSTSLYNLDSEGLITSVTDGVNKIN